MPTKSTAKKEDAESVKKTPVKKAAPAKAPAVEEVYVQFGGESGRSLICPRRRKPLIWHRATARPDQEAVRVRKA